MTPTLEHIKLWFAHRDNLLKFLGNFDLQENGCQLWRGPFFESGHGRYRFDGKDCRVHRVRWARSRGADLSPDICLRHVMCHNPACGNPRHCIGGDWNDNRDDQVYLDGDLKGRYMAFGPGHDTGGEPGSVLRRSAYSVRTESEPR